MLAQHFTTSLFQMCSKYIQSLETNKSVRRLFYLRNPISPSHPLKVHTNVRDRQLALFRFPFAHILDFVFVGRQANSCLYQVNLANEQPSNHSQRYSAGAYQRLMRLYCIGSLDFWNPKLPRHRYGHPDRTMSLSS